MPSLSRDFKKMLSDQVRWIAESKTKIFTAREVLFELEEVDWRGKKQLSRVSRSRVGSILAGLGFEHPKRGMDYIPTRMLYLPKKEEKK